MDVSRQTINSIEKECYTAVTAPGDLAGALLLELS